MRISATTGGLRRSHWQIRMTGPDIVHALKGTLDPTNPANLGISQRGIEWDAIFEPGGPAHRCVRRLAYLHRGIESKAIDAHRIDCLRQRRDGPPSLSIINRGLAQTRLYRGEEPRRRDALCRCSLREGRCN